MNTFDDGSVALFETSDAWEQWLTEHHRCAQLVWLQIAKKGVLSKTVTYDEALDVALCFGWIDGQRKSQDEHYFLQRFTPRRRGSLWSKRNMIKAIRLFEAGKIQPSGLAEIEAAQDDGRWHRAYEGYGNDKSNKGPFDGFLLNSIAETRILSFHRLKTPFKRAIIKSHMW